MILDCSKPEFLLSIPAAEFGRLIAELKHLRILYTNHMGPLNSDVPEVDELIRQADAEFAAHGRFAPLPLVRLGQGDSTRDWPCPERDLTGAPSHPGVGDVAIDTERGATPQVG